MISAAIFLLHLLLAASVASKAVDLNLFSKHTALEQRATKPVAAAYYPDWASDTNPPSDLDFSKFDILLFAFATPNSDSGITYDSGSTSTLQTLVSSAHSSGHGTKVVLSIGKGGWSGSHWFSQSVGSSSNRKKFVDACVSAVNTYNLDGIDIDWEYPNQSGAGNPYSSSDAANLLSFFTELRSALGSSKIISAAVTDLPWIGSDGNPLTDVSAYAKQMTYANIMNYDIFGASTTAPGPNAPLSNACNNSTQPQYSAHAAYTQWTKAGFPASQLLLGLPLYGYASKSTKTSLSDIAEASPLLGAHPHTKPNQTIAETAGDLSSYWGQQIPFNQIVALGALKETSQDTFNSAGGYTEDWDNCSDTPFLFDTSRTTVVTYDDTYSLADKAAYVHNQGMGGCFTWSLDQDYNYVLQDVIRSNLGL
ncbi:hypothetical protein IEO21_02063 [Rhodonia placenta]|uniref:GH18 domain-containing protein n=1 Tax=Rhodonia placenta TaxID=104341 RepID=A0A8H7U5E9_9APHY|nr:hypothetical protein IEO21_02063 [Postia placenta]